MNRNRTTDRTEKLKKLTDRLEQGIQSVFESDRYQEYLTVMGRFHSYSMNNTILIMLQKPDASYVAGYKTWESMGRYVKKGEQGIQILVPCLYKKKEEMEVSDLDRKEKEDAVSDADDKEKEPVKEQQEILYTYFRPAAIFDISQTEGNPLPELAPELQGRVPEYKMLLEALKEAAPVPIRFEAWDARKKGHYDLMKKEIVIKEGMSEQQTIKTAIHETAHSILHAEPKQVKDAAAMEVEAESIAYVVCQHYGLDTSEYSFGYLAGWSSNKELPELKSSLQSIQQTSHDLIERLDRNLFKHINNLDISDTMDSFQEKISASHGISHHRR